MSARTLIAASTVLLAALVASGKPNLARTYRATIDWEAGAGGRDYACGPEDVWRLSGFRYRFEDLEVETDEASVVFGHHGTNVVWAVLIPDRPGRVKNRQFGEETVETIWMRFNPALVGKMFPRKTVLGPGPIAALLVAHRVRQHKINGCMQAENMPIVPRKHVVIFDLDTTTGARRYYGMDSQKKSIYYEPGFAGRPVPLPPHSPITREVALEAFDGAWAAFDEKYAMFGLRPEVDWDRLKKFYRPLAAEAKTAYDAAGAIALLSMQLRDLHVWVKVRDRWLPGFNRFRMLNANYKVTKARIGSVPHEEPGLAWGRTEDGLGYIAVFNLSNAGLPAAFDRALEGLADTWGLVLDLRFNGGGGEDLAIRMAGRFVDEERVYSTNRYRSGPRRDQLGPVLKRKVAPRGPWRYRGPVACLVGRKTMSSAESFALMMAQCPQVTTIGDRTAGSSANPRNVTLPAGIVVNVPTWIDMDPDENPIDEKGYEPEVLVEAGLDDFDGADPVIDRALRRLRKTPKGRRRPAKRD